MKRGKKMILLLVMVVYGGMIIWMSGQGNVGRKQDWKYLGYTYVKEWREEAVFRLLFPYLDMRRKAIDMKRQESNKTQMTKEAGEEVYYKMSKGTGAAEVIGLEDLPVSRKWGEGTDDGQGGKVCLEEQKEEENEERDVLQLAKGGGGLQPKKQKEILAEDYSELQKVINDFFIVDASTSITNVNLNYDCLMNRDEQLDFSVPGPQILILNTHSQEAFADSIPGDESTSIMAVADRLGEILEEQYGYRVYRLRGKYDVETRTGAYTRALEDLEEVLKANPSIQVILDIHRDDMKEENHLVTTVNGKPTAKFMFFNGLSTTAKNGAIDYLHNDYLEDNLAFSFQAKVKAEEYFPGVTRRNYLHAYRYNLHLRPKSMLIEVGAQNNTLEEEMNACEVLAFLLHMVLSGS